MRRRLTLGGGAELWDTSARLRLPVVFLCLVLPLLAATALYQPFLHQWFSGDDFIWLDAASNPSFPSFVKGALSPAGPTPYWRPLIDFYFFSMFRLFSLNAAAYHVGSLLVHGAVGAGTILLAWRLSRSLATGLLAGLLFAVMPAYGIAVTWASSITELMSAVLSLATVLLYLRYLDTDNRNVLGLSSCMFGLALLAHENAGAVPGILIVLGLVVTHPKGRAQVRRLILSLLPFGGVGVVYAVGQVARLYVGSKGSYLDWNAAGRLLDRLRWLSLPVSSSHASVLDAAQWSLLAVFTLVALLALVRRSYELPALFVCTVFALLPSGVLSFTFDPRWTYFAAVLWAGFLAMLLSSFARYLCTYNGLASAAALLLVLGALAYAFIPQTRDAQSSLPSTAAQMEDMSRAIWTECPSLGPGRTAFLSPASPLNDHDYRVSSLVRLLRRGTNVVVAGDATSVRLTRGDCLISWSYRQFAVTEVSAGPHAIGLANEPKVGAP